MNNYGLALNEHLSPSAISLPIRIYITSSHSNLLSFERKCQISIECVSTQNVCIGEQQQKYVRMRAYLPFRLSIKQLQFKLTVQ